MNNPMTNLGRYPERFHPLKFWVVYELLVSQISMSQNIIQIVNAVELLDERITQLD